MCALHARTVSVEHLQDRHGKHKLAVTALTTYKSNSYVNPPMQPNIEASVERTVAEIAPSVAVVITTDETLENYGVKGFPTLAIVDKMGSVRYMGLEIDFEDDDTAGRLIHRLVEE